MPQLPATLRPVLLQPDNFTPPARTPWGGTRITGHYKADLDLPPHLRAAPVGEAWEVSFGPELPSRTIDGTLLTELVARDPVGYLGAEAERGASALLVKLLDAADELSVQIHPAVDDPSLASDETGKPECWYIVEAQPGAGIYIGLQPGASSERMRAALADSADVSQLLRFQPVSEGDFYLLPPGLPHAIGRGVTLIEPQYVAPGKKGLTLRYWDWNRRYDAAGKLDPAGRGRELHVERALAVTDWRSASDSQWLAAQRCALGPARVTDAASCKPLCGPEPSAPVSSPYLRAVRLSGRGTLRLPHWNWNTIRALTVVAGSVQIRGAFGTLQVPRGSSAVLPAALDELSCELDRAHALISSVVAHP
jgi:mannose-6-phosphate isomerase class I